MGGYRFNSPPGWPEPPPDWVPPEGWTPDPSWPPAPPDWTYWVPIAARPHPVAPMASAPTPPPMPPALVAPDPPPPVSAPIVGAGEAATEAPEVEALRRRIASLEAELDEVRAVSGGVDIVELDDQRVLQEVGIYRYHHPLENAAAYKDRLGDLQARIKDAVRAGEAILASDMFTFNNSLAKGRKMTADLSKLMLRAYNAEADNCVRALRAGNVATATKRLEASVASIAKLGAMMEMRVNPAYHSMRIEELELTADYLMKVQEEKEAAREERERLREERKVEQELAAQREKLEKERAHYLNALEALRSTGTPEEIAELTDKLESIDGAIEQNDYRAANVRAGYVYVISNVGAFGPNVVKIGLTRRLEPLDRVRELGDASVPFPFDVHALFFADDAVTLENELHQTFAGARLNHVNLRREFFFATPSEVRAVLAEKVGNLLEFVEGAEATQYRQSRSQWPLSDVAGPT